MCNEKRTRRGPNGGEGMKTLPNLGGRLLWGWVSAALIAASAAQGAYTVRFGEEIVSIVAGETFLVRIVLDADDAEPGNQPLPSGLFSMGIEVTYDPAHAEVAGPDAIVLPAEIDGDGVGGPAPKAVEPGRSAVTGAVALDAVEGYMGGLLATFEISDRSSAPGTTYLLTPGFFFQDTRVNFLDFEGNILDAEIRFEGAQVEVVPEPGILLLLLFGSAVARRRSR